MSPYHPHLIIYQKDTFANCLSVRTFVFLLLYGYYHTYLLIATLFAQKLNYFLIILQSVNYIAIYIHYYRFL